MDEVAPEGPLASFRLDDRLIIVTGASEGIGRTFAEAFARAGAKLVLVSRRREKLEEVRRAIADRGGSAEIVAADVRNLDEIRALADAVRKMVQGNHRKLVLVNNAGFRIHQARLGGHRGRLEQRSSKRTRKVHSSVRSRSAR